MSSDLFKLASTIFPGGVNSPARAMKHLPNPFYVRSAEGAYLFTEDGEKLIDYCMGFGPLILGHRHPAVLRAVQNWLERDWLYGAPTKLEIDEARKIMDHVRSIEMIRFVSTGTEATMNAIRLARGFTGRKYIIKFEGNFHGSHDYVLVKAGSGAATWGTPTSAGVPDEAAKLTIVVPYNDLDALEKAMQERGDEVAAIIMEPIAANYGLIPPREGYVKEVKQLTEEHGTLLILDEVVTGFRVGLEGAQGLFGVKPDLTTLGKIIGGGFPIGAFGGSREIMKLVSPLGPVYNAGTFNAHPVSMVAGLATIKELEGEQAYAIANEAAKRLGEAIIDIGGRAGLDVWVNRVASMFQFYFTKKPVESTRDVAESNEKMYLKVHAEALKRGVYLAPSQYEVNFTSAAHDRDVVDYTIRALEESFKAIK
ncbi:aspartate aminotransferase family protein [Thermocladium modestius]|uniref:Glutamate-1-semialdehyde 2,1-aminomutase n=1 Tax=Thermocladium modestius TaxID=62609 RepID=A0A830GWH1_9CREN|nr:glutamate-1-semialdehyde 2,1-aminomutase [Thermocladium modestius]GGP21150.1 aspartate aminotransferase family protein [Thermocladium modestius]